MAQVISDIEADATALAWLKMVELVYKSPYIPVSELRPSKKQIEALCFEGEECLMGGAMGGGKSDFLLMCALMYVTVPGYSALLLRRTYRQLFQDGGLVPRSKEWIGDKAIFKEKAMQWTFPQHGNSTVTFGYFDHDADRNLYLGGNWQACLWDEATAFKSSWYEFMFSRLRKPDWVCKNCQQPLFRDNFTVQEFQHKRPGSCTRPEPVPMAMNHLGMSIADVPIRMRAASNPGNISHEYFRRRFVVTGAPKKFIKSLLDDNPGLDKEDYKKKLALLDPVTRAQYLHGDWNSYEAGRYKKNWLREFWVQPNRTGDPVYMWREEDIENHQHNGWPACPYGGIPVSMCWNFIAIDPAASKEDQSDYTVIGAFAVTPAGELLVLEIVREKLLIEQIVPRISGMCTDYSPMFVAIEQSHLQLGIMAEARRSLSVSIQTVSHEGKSKLVRSTPAIIRASEGQIFIPKDEPQGKFPWLEDFIAELVQFTGDDKIDSHDDQCDVLAYAVLSLVRHGLFCPIIVTPDADDERDHDLESGIFMTD